MQLENLKQAPFNCTMMGVMRGALDYYGIPVSDASLYGASGHAFVLNIHKELCPSGPYCWNDGAVLKLLGNLGLRVEELGFYHSGSTPEERANVEGILRRSLEAGIPCALVNMENQLITGWDDTGFLTAQPWPCNEVFPPKHLTFTTWVELGGEIHMPLRKLDRAQPVPMRQAVTDSLRYAVDIWRRPKEHTSADYGMGPDGYANWAEAVKAGHGAGHGNWWNGTVYAECRARAGEYFLEIASVLPSDADAQALSAGYAAIAALVDQCSSKELAPECKVKLLAEAAEREGTCVARIERVLDQMGEGRTR